MMYPEEKVRGYRNGTGAVYNDVIISARVTIHTKLNWAIWITSSIEDRPCMIMIYPVGKSEELEMDWSCLQQHHHISSCYPCTQSSIGPIWLQPINTNLVLGSTVALMSFCCLSSVKFQPRIQIKIRGIHIL